MVQAEPEALLETGTRYEHWSELLDTFRTAVVIIDNLHPGRLTIADRTKRVKIESAIELLEGQLNRFSGRDETELGLRRVIDALPSAEEIKDE